MWGLKMMSDFAVELQDVTKVFPPRRKNNREVTAVHHVNLQIESGEFFTLLGASGCGKTTTLRLIAGFEQPSSGHVLLQGKTITYTPPHKRPVNTVFQNYALFPHMTVAQNIAFGLTVKRIPRRECDKRVQEALELVRLPETAQARPGELSGGMQQRVALARALVNRPAVLLLDEPLSALDLKLRQAMRGELKNLQAQVGITFIYVTHDQEEALAMSDRIAVMNNGQVEQLADPATIYNRPANRFVADFIGETNFLSGEVSAQENHRVRLAMSTDMIWASADKPLPVGQPVTLVVRPEKVYLLRSHKSKNYDIFSDAFNLQGTVNHIMYLGTDTRYTVRLSNGNSLIALARNLNGDGPLHLGEPVHVRWHEDDARVLTD